MSDFIKVEQRTLDMLTVGVQQMFARELMNDAQFVGRTAETSFMAEYLAHTMAVRLRAYVLAEHVQDDHRTLKFDYTASWWQHLKLEHFPRWYLKRWPVRYRTYEKKIDLKVYHAYPDARMALPEEQFGKPYVWTTVTPARDCE